MIIKIPVIKKEFVNGEIVANRRELPVDIDTSYKAHLKWEEQFQGQMGCDLVTYTERVRQWIQSPEQTKTHLVGMLKLLYCYVNSKELPTFSDFLGLFDVEVQAEILEKIKTVLEESTKTASKN